MLAPNSSSDLPVIKDVPPVAATISAAPDARCANCGADVTGRYCSACGQKVEYRSHSLWNFIVQATEVLTHGDSRLWRTLGPLMLRPGFLTQQFLSGHRASYLPPFRLYIFLSVIFFMVFALIGPLTTKPSPNRVDQTADAASTEALCRSSVDPLPGPEWIRRPFLNACLKTQADQSRELGRNLIHNLGRAMLVFLPLLAAFTTCLYSRPGRFYVDNLLLLVHDQAFVFLLMSIYLVVLHWLPAGAMTSVLTIGVFGYCIFYFYRSLQTVYSESWLRTSIKFLALAMGYLVCAVGMLFLTSLYTAKII